MRDHASCTCHGESAWKVIMSKLAAHFHPKMESKRCVNWLGLLRNGRTYSVCVRGTRRETFLHDISPSCDANESVKEPLRGGVKPCLERLMSHNQERRESKGVKESTQGVLLITAAQMAQQMRWEG